MSENQEHNRVTIFSNGIADFSRVYQTTGKQQALELPVNKDHIGDILASLIISGPVKLTVPPCFTPANEQTGKLTLSPDNVFQDIFTKLRGAEVEITPSSLSNGGSMHQKQPPANVAVASPWAATGVAEVCPSAVTSAITPPTSTAMASDADNL